MKIGQKDVQHVVKHLSIIQRIIGIKADKCLKLNWIIDDDEPRSHNMMTQKIIWWSFDVKRTKIRMQPLILTSQIFYKKLIYKIK